MESTLSVVCVTPGRHPVTGVVNSTNIGVQRGKRDHTPLKYGEVYSVHADAARNWAYNGLVIIDGERLDSMDVEAKFADAQPRLLAEKDQRIAELAAELESLRAASAVDPIVALRAEVDQRRKEAGLAPVHHLVKNEAKLRAALAEAEEALTGPE